MFVGSNGLAARCAAVATSDSADNSYSYLYVGGAGDVAIVTEGGDSVTLKTVPAGSFVWVRTRTVEATGTTATNIVGFR